MMALLTNILTSILKNLEKWGTFQSLVRFLKIWSLFKGENILLFIFDDIVLNI